MTDNSTRVAIVGMACRYPGAPDLDAYWDLIRDGKEALTHYTDEEILASGVPQTIIAASNYVKVASTLENIEMFDAKFFGYSRREASFIDPQQRLFLETAWQSVEHAGYDPNRFDGRIAVFGGTDISEYFLNNLMPRRWEHEHSYGFDFLVINNDKDSLTSRVSYKLNLRGPSMAVSCNCSTSLVATWLGWQSLVDYQSDMVLVGGVSSPAGKRGHSFVKGAIYSPDGRLRPFDKSGAGIRVGAGVGVVVLKRLDDAVAAGDQIYAVICGAAVNHGGSDKVGYTAPNVQGQAEVITEALAIAGFSAESIGYVEAHGTATPLGDPIEIAALTRAFRTTSDKKQFCAIGSVKANIGHAMAAAGTAGLIKATLALKNHTLPPAINFEAPNPEIDFANSPVYVNTELKSWDNDGAPRRAGISSFGIGGTNAHVVLEEAPERRASSPSQRTREIIGLSAKTQSALESATDNLVRYLVAHPEAQLADLSFTLLVGRAEFPFRRIAVVASVADLIVALEGRQPPPGGSDPLVTLALDWKGGAAVDWMQHFAGEERRRLALPTYPFERIRCWIDSPAAVMPLHAGLGSELSAATRTVPPPKPTEPFERTVPYVEPTNEIEREIAAMWEELLDLRPIGIHDNFLELGGDSLLISRVITRIRETYDIDVSVQTFMQATRLDEMALVVAGLLANEIEEGDLAELLAAMEDEEGDG